MNRKQVTIATVVVLLIVFSAIGLFYFLLTPKTSSNDSGSTVTISTNQDTGEQTIGGPSISKTETDDATNVTLYGVADLIDATNIFQQQVDFIKQQLYAYSNKNLQDKYDTLTIRPEDLKVNGDTATTTLRLGSGSTLVNIQINGIQSGQMQLLITDPTGKNGGNFDSGISTVHGD